MWVWSLVKWWLGQGLTLSPSLSAYAMHTMYNYTPSSCVFSSSMWSPFIGVTVPALGCGVPSVSWVLASGPVSLSPSRTSFDSATICPTSSVSCCSVSLCGTEGGWRSAAVSPSVDGGYMCRNTKHIVFSYACTRSQITLRMKLWQFILNLQGGMM